MIIIIVVSGIIVFGVIITVKYFNEEDADKIGPVLKRVVMWQLPNEVFVSFRIIRSQLFCVWEGA
jgi:hypothetical protein